MVDSKEEWAEISRANFGVPEVTAEWVSANEGFTLVDVREAAELEGPLGQLEGNVHLPLGELEDGVDDWARDRAYVIYCRSGGRSGRAAMIMEEMGFERVASMAGGMIRWNALEFPRL